MTRRTITLVLGAIGWLALAGAIAWPAIALGLTVIAQGCLPQDGFGFSSRQLLLLWRSLWMSGASTVIAVLISLPAALVIGRGGRPCHSAFVVASLAAVLFCPPMVLAFGWERVLPGWTDPTVRCIAVWSLWTWPIASLIVGAGWSRTGRLAHEAASLSSGAVRAFIEVGIPSLWRYILLAAAIIFVILGGEYTVPHACGLVVYATELLGWAANSVNTIDSLWPALPVATVGVIGVALAWRISGGCTGEAAVDPPVSARPRTLTGLAWGLFATSWVVPLVGLTTCGGGLGSLTAAQDVYGQDVAVSLGVAAAAGFLVTCIGVATAMSGASGGRIAVVAIAWGILPGALTGDAMVAAYNRETLGIIYDHWPIVAICYASRFAWIGAMLGLLPRAMTVAELVSQARTDGATEWSLGAYITIPIAASPLVCGFAISMALSVGELPATTLVRVPDYNPIAHVIIEKFHRFEEEMLVALSLFLVAATIPAVLTSLVVLRLRK